MQQDRLEFIVDVLVLPKQGHDSIIMQPKAKGARPFIKHYTRKPQRNNAFRLAQAISPFRPSEPFDGPIEVELHFISPWRSVESGRVKTSGRYRRKDTHPDNDNLSKQVLDVLESEGFLASDARVSDLILKKRWGPGHSLRVRIEKLDLLAEPVSLTASDVGVAHDDV